MISHVSEWQSRIVGHGEEPADQLLANPRNWRIHPKSQQDALAGVLDNVGWVQNVIVNQRTGHIVDGHLRVSLAISRNESVPVIYVDLDEEEEALILATIDPLSAMAGRDDDMLAELVSGVTAEGALGDLLAELAGPREPEAGLTDPDDVPEEPDEPYVQRGEIYQLGEHRVMCGDSTNAADVARLMAGERADAVVTDPPYGINQAGVPGDEPENHVRLMGDVVPMLPVKNAAVVAFASPRTFPVWLDAVRENGHQFERMLWLYKEAQIAHPWRGWLLTSEAILVSSIGEAQWEDAHPYAHDCYKVSEVRGELPEGIGWHGSVKPVAVVGDIVGRASPKSARVYDPFLGSGTTLIAAEQLGRRCYGMEIEPRYVQVAIERWQQFTGKEAVRVREG